MPVTFPVTFQHHPLLTFLSRELDPLYHFLSCYFFFLCAFSPVATSPTTFFNGEISTSSKSNKSFVVLASSTMISWIFAKSVQNASVLGAKFGIAGGFGYASWYVCERSSTPVLTRSTCTHSLNLYSLAQPVLARVCIANVETRAN